jgi:predicted metallo-beta-lactamase superfamily hydrolase
MFRLSSDAVTTIDTMLRTANTPTFQTEATVVASASPCWHSFDEKRLLGYVLALAGRCAR